jgi:hypothetical protein
VIDFASSPDGRRVFYRADEGEDGVVRLFVAPVAHAGSGGSFAGTVGPAGDVEELLVTPDGARAIYVLDGNQDDVLELFVTEVRPAITSVSPSGGRADAVVTVTLEGDNFLPDAVVTFGGTPGIVTKFVDGGRMQVRVPPLAGAPVGPTQVTVPVVVSDGVLTSTTPATYTYFVPSAPPGTATTTTARLPVQ